MKNAGNRIWLRLDQMSPGYFALVMSTGIVSLALVLFWVGGRQRDLEEIRIVRRAHIFKISGTQRRAMVPGLT